jgi:hypothetical protein
VASVREMAHWVGWFFISHVVSGKRDDMRGHRRRELGRLDEKANGSVAAVPAYP